MRHALLCVAIFAGFCIFSCKVLQESLYIMKSYCSNAPKLAKKTQLLLSAPWRIKEGEEERKFLPLDTDFMKQQVRSVHSIWCWPIIIYPKLNLAQISKSLQVWSLSVRSVTCLNKQENWLISFKRHQSRHPKPLGNTPTFQLHVPNAFF